MTNEKINSFSYSTLIVSLCCATFYGIFSSYIVNKANNSSLISIFIGYIISLIFAKVILMFFNKKEEMNHTQKIKYLFPKISIVINIISILCTMFGYTLITYRLTTFLSNQYLISTPQYIISLLIILLTYYTASKGIETIFRVSVVTFFISAFIFFFDLFSLLPQINFQNYFPIIDANYKDIIISSIIFSFYFIMPIAYLNVVPLDKIKDKNKLNKYYYLMITFSFLIIFLSIFTCIGVNGINVTKIFDYPVYSTLKRIKLFSALDSLENISYTAWFLFTINLSNLMLIYIFTACKESFNLNKKKSNIINLIIIITLFSIPNFIFSNNNFNESFTYIYIPMIFLGITLFIIIISLIKYKFIQKKRTISSS